MEQYYLFFLIYSFFGWCMESTLFSIREKRFVNRGFLNGPLCPIYGIGMVLIIYFLEPYSDNMSMLFVLGLVLATILEFLTGYILEKIFKTRWWDYTKKKFNFMGYICLENSLDWGILCVIMIKLIQPLVVDVINSFSEMFLNVFMVVSASFLIADIIVTLANLINLRSYIINLNFIQMATTDLKDISKKYHDIYEEMVNHHITLGDYLDEIAQYKQASRENLKNKIVETREKYRKPKKQLRRIYRNYKPILNPIKQHKGAMLAKKDLENQKDI
ncbi:putative membrane protein [Bacilli bacterium PM5-3]|nr:putative membrane protein [Bacilli bacterium PM5-3]MDH6603791.1 putative membrane protein [Bacilli bacterium PM5-9]